jgi:hypothetical protein
MKTRKLTFAILALLFTFSLVSCNKDDEKKTTVDLVVGSYSFKAESIWSTADANFDLVDTLIITKVDDETVSITGLIPYDSLGVGSQNVAVVNPLTAKIDLTTMTFKIPVGQALTESKTNGYVLHFYPGDPATLKEYEIDVTNDEYVTGTIKDNGDIKLIGPWGIKWIDPNGGFDGKWWWDFYVVTNMIKL